MLLDEGFLDKLRQRLDSNEKSNDVFLKKLNDLKRKLIMIQDPKEAEKIRNRFWQNVAIANTLKKYKNRGSSQDMSKISDAELQALRQSTSSKSKDNSLYSDLFLTRQGIDARKELARRKRLQREYN